MAIGSDHVNDVVLRKGFIDVYALDLTLFSKSSNVYIARRRIHIFLLIWNPLVSHEPIFNSVSEVTGRAKSCTLVILSEPP